MSCPHTLRRDGWHRFVTVDADSRECLYCHATEDFVFSFTAAEAQQLADMLGVYLAHAEADQSGTTFGDPDLARRIVREVRP